MKLAMLLVSVHFLATAVEARPRGGSRQLGEQKKIPNATATVGPARLPTVTANRAPGERHINTTMKWLSHARPGVCAPTEITQGNCHTGAKGAWALRREQSTDWHTTVNHCLRLCSSCPRCGYISVHAAEPAECNWFAECDLKGKLKAADGWRSGHAGAAASSIATSAAVVASIENQAARDAPVHCDARPLAGTRGESDGFRGLNASACILTYPPRNLYPFRLRQLHQCGAATKWSRELLETMPLPYSLTEEQLSLIRRPAACLCASCQYSHTLHALDLT